MQVSGNQHKFQEVWFLMQCKSCDNGLTDAEEDLEQCADCQITESDEFKLDEREQLINALMMLENITGKWTVEAEAEFLEMDDLQQRIDPDAGPEDVPPMPGKGGGFDVKDKQTGQEYGVSNSN